MPQFMPDEQKRAIAPITVAPPGLSCEAELFLGLDENAPVASSGLISFVSTGSPQQVLLPVAMPSTPGVYHVYIDVDAGGISLVGYIAAEDVIISTPPPPPPQVTVSCTVVPSWVRDAWGDVVDIAGLTLWWKNTTLTIPIKCRAYMYWRSLGGGDLVELFATSGQDSTMPSGSTAFVYFPGNGEGTYYVRLECIDPYVGTVFTQTFETGRL